MEGEGIDDEAVGDLVAIHTGVAVRQELGVQIRRGGVRPPEILLLEEIHISPQPDDDAEDVLDAHARRVHSLVKYLMFKRPFDEMHAFPDVRRLREDGISVHTGRTACRRHQ